MVLPGEEEDYMAATRHERSKNLHNFTLPGLKWGSQRNLRSIKVDGGAAAGYQRSRRRSSPFEDATPFRFDDGSDKRSNSRDRRLETEASENEGIEEFGEKIISDLRTLADKMRESMFRNQASGDEEEEEHNNDKEKQKKEKSREREVSPPEAPGEAVEARPWNLRKRRAVCKAPISGYDHQYNREESRIEEKRVMMDPSIPLRFFSTLSKKEIEEDYMRIMGHRPPRRPKKRLRNVQKRVDLLKPAFYFSEITEDIY